MLAAPSLIIVLHYIGRCVWIWEWTRYQHFSKVWLLWTCCFHRIIAACTSWKVFQWRKENFIYIYFYWRYNPLWVCILQPSSWL